MKHYILYNPLAGNADCSEKIEELKVLYGEDTECLNLTEMKDYRTFAESLSPDDVIIICGGDGTINRFVNNTEGIEINSEILYFPTGTGNDFVRDLEGVDTAKPFSIKRYIENLPTVEVNGKSYRFLNGVGYGIDGYCCEFGDRLKAESTKPVNYTAIAIKGLLFRYHPTNAVVTVDGVRYEYKKVWIAPTMNGRFYGGGMMPAPEQDRLNNGELTVMLFHGSGKIKTLMVFPSLFKGEHIKHTEMVAIHKGKEITVEFDSPAPLQIDGETVIGVKSYKATAPVLTTDFAHSGK